MRKITIYIILTFVSSATAFAQKTDSLATQNKLFSLNIAEFNKYQFAKTSPFYIKKLMPLNYSELHLGYNYDKGHLKPAQDAEIVQQTYLNTEGISQLGTVSIWGKFSYTKSQDDSVQFAHRTNNNLANPYYFGSPINVNYQRTVYNLSTLVSKEFFNNKLPIGLGADYRIGNHYSTNDPRGDIKDYQLNLIGTIGYNINEHLKFGIGYRYGYGLERVNVAYKNTSLSQGVVKPLYNTYLINGYGEAEVFNTNRTVQNNQTRNGIDAYLSYNSDLFGDINLAYQSIKDKQAFDYRTSDGILEYIKFNLVTDNYKLLWYKKLNSNALNFQLNILKSKGDNFINKYLSNSYLYRNQTISGNLTYSIVSNKLTHNVNFGINNYKERKQDGVAGNDIEFNQLTYSLGYGINLNSKQNHNWSIDISAIYNQYLNSKFNVLLANEKLFTQKVIYYDYALNTTSKYGGSISSEYSIPMFKLIQAGIKVSCTYLKREELIDFGRILSNAPGNDRFSSNISLNLYF